MFTFGRDHEKECAAQYVRNPQQVRLIEEVVDGVHDLLEGRTTVDAFRVILSRGFVEGGAGVWEQTGSWLRKLVAENPSFQSVWLEFARHSDWRVRFRAACFIDQMPTALASEIGARLNGDPSKKVRKMVENRLRQIADEKR